MHKVVIADTSCFIILHNIGEMQVLHRHYGKVFTTLEVAIEFGQSLPDWVEIKKLANPDYQAILELKIDKGESSAIALAVEMPGSSLILDDRKARKVAARLGLKYTGTIGILVKAKKDGILPSLRSCLEKIRTTDFRLSPELESLALREAGEE